MTDGVESPWVTCHECGRPSEVIEHAGDTIYVHNTGGSGELHDYCIERKDGPE